jgi:hypothetical protein
LNKKLQNNIFITTICFENHKHFFYSENQHWVRGLAEETQIVTSISNFTSDCRMSLALYIVIGYVVAAGMIIIGV